MPIDKIKNYPAKILQKVPGSNLKLRKKMHNVNNSLGVALDFRETITLLLVIDAI